MGRLDGKVAIVTGAARGTGETTARLFANEGARVFLTDVLDAAGEAVAKEIGGEAAYHRLDVSSESDWQTVVDRAVERFGRLDVLINNAGILHMAAITDTALEDYERVVRVNQIGTFLGMRAVVEPMKAVGGGSIVNVSSIDGLQGKNGLIAYCATKWAVRGMTKVGAIELGKFGIRVNAVCPEAGSTDMIRPYVPEGVDVDVVRAHGQPLLATQKERTTQDLIGDISNMLLFLASDESASCTGGDFPVEGGNTAGRRVRGAPGA